MDALTGVKVGIPFVARCWMSVTMPVLPLGEIPAFRTHAQRIGAGIGVAYGWVATGKQLSSPSYISPKPMSNMARGMFGQPG